VIHNPATGDLSCKEAEAYKDELKVRKLRELHEYIALTGKNINQFKWYAPDGFKSGSVSPKQIEVPSSTSDDDTQNLDVASIDDYIQDDNDVFIPQSIAKGSGSLGSNALGLLLIPVVFAGLMWIAKKKE